MTRNQTEANEVNEGLSCVRCGKPIGCPKIWNHIWLRMVCDQCFEGERKNINARYHQKRKTQKDYIAKRRVWERNWDRKNRPRKQLTSRLWYAKNKDRINAKKRDRYKSDPNYREKMRANSRAQGAAHRIQRERLVEGYIRQLLSTGTRIKQGEWPLEVVELKRKQIEAMRLINEDNERNPGNVV